MTAPGTVVLDPEAQALYIHTHDSKIVRTLELSSNIFVDFDADGKVVGIEALFLTESFFATPHVKLETL